MSNDRSRLTSGEAAPENLPSSDTENTPRGTTVVGLGLGGGLR